MTVKPSTFLWRWSIVILIVVSALLVTCGPVLLPIPTPEPPSPYFDVATLLPGTFLMGAPSLSADGRYLAVGETEFAGVVPQDLVLFDLEKQKIIQQVYIGSVLATAVSPSGGFVATDKGDGRLYIFETGTDTPAYDVPGSVPTWSPDDQQLAYATSSKQAQGNWQVQIRLLDLVSGRQQIVFERSTKQAYILPLAWSPDGRMVAFNLNFPSPDPLGPDSVAATLFLLDLENESATVVAEDWEIHSLRFTPDSAKLLFLGTPLPLNRSAQYGLYVANETGACHRVATPLATRMNWRYQPMEER